MFCVTLAFSCQSYGMERNWILFNQRGDWDKETIYHCICLFYMEVLKQRIKKSVSIQEWKPIKLTRGWPNISHLFLANDLFLFREGLESQAGVMEKVIWEFCDISCQKVNVAKSKLYVSKNTNGAIELSISSKWDIPLISDSGKYLGFPVIHGRTTTKTYQDMVSERCKRGWLDGRLSFCRRLLGAY